MRRLIIAFLASLFLISCATVTDYYKNPVEEAAANKDQYAKVIFYNDTNLILWPSSSAVGIEIVIDGIRAARLERRQYIDLYVKKGRHELTLIHWDLFKFTDNYNIELTDDNYIIELYCRPFSTPYEVDPLPQN
jgi:hypothetical protein